MVTYNDKLQTDNKIISDFKIFLVQSIKTLEQKIPIIWILKQ